MASMSSMSDFRRVADDVRNWGRWGDDDELGTLNFITPDKVAEAAALVRHGKVFPLGVDFGSGGPQGAFQYRHNPIHVMTVDGGDANTLVQYGPDWLRNSVAQQLSGSFAGENNPFRFNDDMIIMTLQAATQWDAISHVYYDDQLYNGFPASSVTSLGAYHCGIDKVDGKGITSRGVLLDVVKVHTGWWSRFLQNGDGTEPGAGLDWLCAAWLHDHEVAAVAADNLMVEDPVSAVEGTFLPMHMLCLRDMGMMFGEYWNLTPLAADW